MDKIKAQELEKKLKNKKLKGYRVAELINNGKSAAVFKAEKNKKLFALKVFDNELIERFGYKIQATRIKQEIALKDHSIKGLVKVYEGGDTDLEDQKYYFIIMEYIEGDNLKDYIQNNTYNLNFIKKILQSLYYTTEQLIKDKKIAHRDIKPENIMISKDEEVILMDLGVLKIIGARSFSDEEEKSFVGTLRYAAPEFLLRKEKDDINGWRAVNLYQIGATLHDLIMKKEIFEDKTPYSNLVLAIKEDYPEIKNQDIPFNLLQLTRNFLTKDPIKRIELLDENKLKKILSKKDSEDSLEAELEQILHLRSHNQSKFDEIDKIHRSKEENEKKRKEFGGEIILLFEEIFDSLESQEVFQTFDTSSCFKFFGDDYKENLVQNYLYELNGDLKMGYPSKLYFLFRFINDANGYTEIETIAIFPKTNYIINLNRPLGIFEDITKSTQRVSDIIGKVGPTQCPFNFNSINLFEGVLEFDKPTKNFLTKKILRIIFKALKTVEKEVEEKITEKERLAKSNTSMTFSKVSSRKFLIIDGL